MKRVHSAIVVIVGIAGSVGLSSCGGALTSGPTTTITKIVTVTATSGELTSTSEASAGPATAIPGDGTFVVGTDIAPGTYKSEKPSSGFCSWARLNKLSGITDISAVIKNGNSMGQSFVTIEPTDVAFASQMCEPWQKVG